MADKSVPGSPLREMPSRELATARRPRRGYRTMQFATRISLETKRGMQTISQRDNISLVELLEEALVAYLYRLMIKKGRPKIGRQGKRSEQFATRVTKEFYTTIHDVASAQGCALVEVLEESIRAYESVRSMRRRLTTDETALTLSTLKMQMADPLTFLGTQEPQSGSFWWDESDMDYDGYSGTYDDPNGEHE